MRNLLIVGSVVVALIVGFVAGYSMRPAAPRTVVVSDGERSAAPRTVVARSSDRPAVARSMNIGDEHEAWANVPATSPQYATAQRLLGWNYYAHDKHDYVEAKRHVDLALQASPNDPMVLEDAGRVYIMAGFTDEGTAMLKKADTRQAREFLAKQKGT